MSVCGGSGGRVEGWWWEVADYFLFVIIKRTSVSFVIQILISIIAGFDVYIATVSHVLMSDLMSVPVCESNLICSSLCNCVHAWTILHGLVLTCMYESC